MWREIDAYCERMGPEYWAEPINAITNLAFVLAAFWAWRHAYGGLARVLCLILAGIGVGSYLFHTHAQVWSAVADVAPIAMFVFVYIFAANRHYWGLSALWAGVATLGFVPFAALTGMGFAALPFFNISAAYWPVALIIALYALALRQRLPQVSRGLAIGVAVLTVSLIARSVDMPLCGAIPLGTHFLWHIFNGIMLGWMIFVLSRHLLEQDTRRG